MIIYVIKKTNKKGVVSEIEVYSAKKNANNSAEAKNRFGKMKGETYEVIPREVPDDTVLPSYSY